MSAEKRGPTHSQIVGIIWLSVGLIVFAGVAFFLSQRGADAPEEVVATEVRDSFSTPVVSHGGGFGKRQARPKESPGQFAGLSDSAYSHQAPPLVRKPLTVDINGADTLTLQLLHGIGPAYAARIVRYRNRLGGFVDKEQLLEVYGFTPELLSHIAPCITVDTTAVSRIRINRVGLKELVRHPYIEYYQARDVIMLRNGGQRFRSLEDLRAIPSMADSTLQRLAPYLDFSDGADAADTVMPVQ